MNDIRSFVFNDDDLLELYQTDNTFRTTIDMANDSKMNVVSGLTFALIEVCKSKNNIKKSYIKAINNGCTSIRKT